MARWYGKISTSVNFYEPLGEAIEYFYSEYELARMEIRPTSDDEIKKTARDLPGIVEHRWGQLQEIEGIHKFLEIHYDKVKGDKKRHFYEHYNRQLSERLADQYADIEPEVLVIREFIQQIALIRNLYIGITKGLEYMHFQIGNIIKLRSAGIEDATF